MREKKKYAMLHHPIEDRALADLALRFTLSQSITSAIPPGDAQFFDMVLDVAAQFRPVNDEEIALLRQRLKRLSPSFN